MEKATLLVQEGIYLPLDYASEFAKPVFFKLNQKKEVFLEHRESEFLLIRANCLLLPEEINLLPKLKYIGLVSTGVDNVPLDYLKEKKITLVTGEGANAWAVFEYCVQAIFYWIAEYPEEAKRGLGLIGCGRIGSLLYRYFSEIGFPVKFYDPFLAKTYSLSEVLGCGLLSLHVPLTYEGPHPTYEMVSQKIFQKNVPRIMNTARGKVIEKNTLAWLCEKNRLWAQDVYYDEPPQFILPARFSTPHIAGYSTRGRLMAIEKVLKQMFKKIPNFPYPNSEIWFLAEESKLFCENPKIFNDRRDNFPWRKEIFEFKEKDWYIFRKYFREVPEVYIEKLNHYGKSIQGSLGINGNFR